MGVQGKKLEWMPLYVHALAADVYWRTLDLAQRGAYMELLMIQWNEGHIPDCRATIQRLINAAPGEMDGVMEVVDAKFVPVGLGRLVNPRLAEIREYQMARVEQMRANGRSGGRPSGGARRPANGASKSSTHSYSEQFRNFYQAYPLKAGKLAASRAYDKAVKRLADEHDDPHAFLRERAEAFAASPKGKGRFVQHPSTWLNGGHYGDDPAAWQRGDPDSPESRRAMIDEMLRRNREKEQKSKKKKEDNNDRS